MAHLPSLDNGYALLLRGMEAAIGAVERWAFFRRVVDWIDEEICLAGISRDDCRLFLAGPAFRAGRGNSSPVMVWLNLGSKAEVNELHREWSASNATLLSAPRSEPWGLHEFTATDPDGNRFRVFYDFATPERDKTSA